MMCPVNALQVLHRNVRIHLRGRNIRVSQQALHRPQVRAMLHHMRRATVTQHMRARFALASRGTPNHLPHPLPGERLAARMGRDVLDAVTAEIRLERVWSPTEVESARQSSDPRIVQAVSVADKHGVAETMAAGPALLRDWRDAWAATPRPTDRTHADARGAALVTAAVDIRRAGYHRPLESGMLRDLHEVYLADRGGAVLHPGTWENAVEWATTPLHATSSLIDPLSTTW